MRVSVIIPVYNAGGYVKQAVESALQQPETEEVILVEDGSTDNSLEVCRRLASDHDRVQLLRHPGGENRGAGASRNLGMRQGSCEYIAFLDADDYFLPGRFSVPREMFEADPDCDGAYEAAGFHVENEVGLDRWTTAGKPVRQLTTMSERVIPERLWDALISSGRYGYFHLDGLVLKRNVLAKSGYMNVGLRLHQDTEFTIRAAISARLLPGRLEEPVALVRIHGGNRITAPRSEEQKYRDRMLMWAELYRWCKGRRLGEIQLRIMEEMIRATTSETRSGKVPTGTFSRRARKLLQLAGWILRNPRALTELPLWQSIGALFRKRVRRAGELQAT